MRAAPLIVLPFGLRTATRGSDGHSGCGRPQGPPLQSSWLGRRRGGRGGLLLGLDQRLGGDTLQQRLGVGAQATSLFADAAIGRERGHGTVQDAVPLDVVGLEILLLVAGLRLESHAEGADLVELDGHGVEQMLLHDVEEFYEHGGNIGARDGRGVADLLGELARGDRAQADGLAVPLAVDDAVLQMALNYFVSDRHNGWIFRG